MTRRARPAAAPRRRSSAARPRPDADRVSLRPLTYPEAVKGLFAVKPGHKAADSSVDQSEEKEVSEDV
jgi:hypothetical protein